MNLFYISARYGTHRRDNAKMDCNENTSCAVEDTDESLKVGTNSACLEEGLSPVQFPHVTHPNHLFEPPVDGNPKPASSSAAEDSSLVPRARRDGFADVPRTIENTITDNEIPGFGDFDSNIAAVIENTTSSLSETRGQAKLWLNPVLPPSATRCRVL